jgi:putative exosortase-associated protein (TIGR04073 family)
MNTARQLILAASAGLVLCVTPAARAETAAAKFARGAAGIATGVLEVPGNIVQQTREKGAIGVPIGLALGLGMFVTRELVGVYEFLTAPFPIPAGFKPILSPEYPWSYFAVTPPPPPPAPPRSR